MSYHIGMQKNTMLPQSDNRGKPKNVAYEYYRWPKRNHKSKDKKLNNRQNIANSNMCVEQEEIAQKDEKFAN